MCYSQSPIHIASLSNFSNHHHPTPTMSSLVPQPLLESPFPPSYPTFPSWTRLHITLILIHPHPILTSSSPFPHLIPSSPIPTTPLSYTNPTSIYLTLTLTPSPPSFYASVSCFSSSYPPLNAHVWLCCRQYDSRSSVPVSHYPNQDLYTTKVAPIYISLKFHVHFEEVHF